MYSFHHGYRGSTEARLLIPVYFTQLTHVQELFLHHTSWGLVVQEVTVCSVWCCMPAVSHCFQAYVNLR